MIFLATSDLFKTYYNLEPGRVQTLQAFTMLPWSFKIIYGLISDNFPIFGSRRKSYLLLMASVQFTTMIALGFQPESETSATWLLFFSNLGIAFSDVIVDSLMVIQARRHPNRGSEDLNTFSWTFLSLGGLLGSLAAAFLTENYEPRYCFLLSSAMSLAIITAAARLRIQLEFDGLEA